jgi:hypothetical protein
MGAWTRISRVVGRVVGLGLLLLVVAWPSLASAQKKKRVIRLEEITVEGRIQKPQAFYILPRSNLDYEALERKESFLGEIEASLHHDPF